MMINISSEIELWEYISLLVSPVHANSIHRVCLKFAVLRKISLVNIVLHHCAY